MSTEQLLLRRWDQEMLDLYEEAKGVGYNATRFRQMLGARGGLDAARMLIHAKASGGFTKLWELHRLDISVEARALKPEFSGLFSPEEIETCRARLRAHGWKGELQQ